MDEELVKPGPDVPGMPPPDLFRFRGLLLVRTRFLLKPLESWEAPNGIEHADHLLTSGTAPLSPARGLEVVNTRVGPWSSCRIFGAVIPTRRVPVGARPAHWSADGRSLA